MSICYNMEAPQFVIKTGLLLGKVRQAHLVAIKLMDVADSVWKHEQLKKRDRCDNVSQDVKGMLYRDLPFCLQ